MTLSPSDLEQLFDRPVIVTPLDAAPPPDAVVYWNANNEGFIVQPLHTAEDRKLLARQIEAIRKEQTERKP